MKEQSNYLLGKIAVVIILSIALLALAGCQPQSDDAPASSSAAQSEANNDAQASTANNIGNFNTVDLNDAAVTQDIFKENDLTMINVFSSMCNPCMAELPDLAALSEEYKGKRFGIVGLNMDLDMEGKPDEASKEAVKEVLKNAGSAMTVIFPEDTLLEKVVMRTDAIPYSIFVDKNGNIVGKDYMGSHTKAEWQAIIEEAIENEK